MASIEYVVSATDAASGVFAKIAASADGLDKQLADLSKRVATPEIDLKDKKFTLGMINAAKRLDVLSAKVADPAVEVDTAKAQTEILRISAMLDRLDAKKITVGAGAGAGGRGGLLSRLGGLFGGGGAAGAAGGAGRAAAGFGGLPPQAQVGAVIAGLAALPFAAQAAAGGITLALGGALTGVGILAAATAKRVKADWTGLFAREDILLRQVVQPFVGALKQISQVGQSVLPTIMMGLVGPMKILAPAFQTVADALLRSFAQPAVASAMQAIAKAFGAILKALAPQLAGDIKAIANGITNIANAVAKNPKAFADFISFFFHLAGAVLNAIGWLTQIADVIEKKVVPNMVRGFAQMGHAVAKDFDTMRHDIAHQWDQIFQNTIGAVIRLNSKVLQADRDFRHSTAVIFDGVRHDAAAIWDTIWNNTVGRVQRGIGDVTGWFRKLPGEILAALRGLGHTLGSFASAALTEFWNGFKNIGANILHWLGGFLNSLVGLAKKILGVFSPSSVFYDIGKNMMLGLEGGIKAHAHAAVNAAKAAAQAAAGAGAHGGPTSASAAQAQAYARSRLGAYGWGSSEMGPLIALWNQESGWNRLARNPSSGAYGIPQALPASKMGAAANPPMSSAAAQINWGLGYIKGRYGSPSAAEAHERAFNWYERGAWNVPYTGPAVVHAGEMIIPAQAAAAVRSGAGGNTYNITVHVPPSANKAEVGRATVEAIKEFEKRSGAGWRS